MEARHPWLNKADCQPNFARGKPSSTSIFLRRIPPLIDSLNIEKSWICDMSQFADAEEPIKTPSKFSGT